MSLSTLLLLHDSDPVSPTNIANKFTWQSGHQVFICRTLRFATIRKRKLEAQKRAAGISLAPWSVRELGRSPEEDCKQVAVVFSTRVLLNLPAAAVANCC